MHRSDDGDVMFGSDGWSYCVECMAATHEGDVRQHAPGCSLGLAPRPSISISRTTDPNLYVWTSNGLERAMDVERRRRRSA